MDLLTLPPLLTNDCQLPITSQLLRCPISFPWDGMSAVEYSQFTLRMLNLRQDISLTKDHDRHFS